MKIGLFLSVASSFLLSAVFCPLLIPVLRRLKFGQNERKEGNPEHQKKQGTPVMGALAFLPAILITAVVFGAIFSGDAVMKWIPVIFLTVGFGIIGFLDDILKIKKKQNEGLKVWQKLILQVFLSVGFAVYCYLSPEIGSKVILPFAGGREWDMKWLYLPFAVIAILGTDNGTNFTDGVDGLLSSVTVVTALFLCFASEKLSGGVSYLSGAVAGALMGYLLSNAHPAKVFMGDTGSLAIGGFVAGSALVMRMGWFILLFGFIYLMEVVSVVLQVGFFKLTHGKRLFKMAPIHHHFELLGQSETQVVTLFTVITVLASLLAAFALLG